MRCSVVPSLFLAGGLFGCVSGASPPPPSDQGSPVDLGAPHDLIGPSDLGAPPPTSLRVLSLNLHCLKVEGTVYPDNAQRFDAVARAAADRGVDVLLAQEVCERPGESARGLLLAALTRRSGAAWSVETAFAHRAWVGTPDEADEHVAIFARDAALNGAGAGRHPYRVQGGLLRVALGVNYRGLRLYSVHLDHLDAAVRAAQGRETAALAVFETDPGVAALLAGDFNAQPGAAAPQALLDSGFVDAAAALPADRIDHVFVHRGAPLLPQRAELLFTGAEAVSDHPGVLVVLAGRAAPALRLTRIAAAAPAGLALWVRGAAAPLSWTAGWPAFLAADGRHRFVTSELPAGAFEYKLLRDDRDWQVGSNVTGQGQADNQAAPTFP